MGKFWEQALKVTGPVAVVGFLIWSLLWFVFREDVVALFGSNRLFLILLTLIFVMAIALISSILFYKQKGSEDERSPIQRKGNKTIINHSKIKGDVVSGDKYVNSKDENE